MSETTKGLPSLLSTFVGTPTPGVSAVAPEALMRPDDLVVAVARFIHDIHALFVDPEVDARDHRAAQLIRASERVASGAVDEFGFDPPYGGQSAERLVAIAAELDGRIGSSPAVAVHGALALDGLSLHEGRVCGWPELDAIRVGDRYCDLSFIARDLAGVVGPQCVPALFDAYGLERPDPLAVEFWVTLRQVL